MYLNSFLNLKTKSSLKRNSSIRNTIDFDRAKKIGVLFSAESLEKHNAVKGLIKELEGEGKKVEVISFLDEGKENHEFKFNFFTSKDISLFGSILNEDLLSFINTDFDYMFVLDPHLNNIFKNILAESKSKCRVGRYSLENSPYFELMISPVDKSSIREFIGEILDYSRKINSNGVNV